MDFETQVKLFTDQLEELLEQAKFAASQDFASERSNWEQTAREYEAALNEMRDASVKNLERAEAAEQKYMSLQAKLSALV